MLKLLSFAGLVLVPLGLQVGCFSTQPAPPTVPQGSTGQGFNVIGNVYDLAGYGVPGIQVTLASVPGGSTSSAAVHGRSGQPVAAVVPAGGSAVATTTTDAAGDYTFSGVAAGTYTVTPSISGPSSLFLPGSQITQVVDADTEADFEAQLGYTVSGTLTYTSPKVAQSHVIHITLAGSPSGTGVYQPAITLSGNPASGTFTAPFVIRGVQPGTYSLNAFLDLNTGNFPNADNPAASPVAVTVGSADVAVGSVALVDPTPAVLDSTMKCAAFYVTPMANGVAVRYSPITNASGQELPVLYKVEWNTDFTSDLPANGGSVNILANGPGISFIQASAGNNLVLGTSYAWRVSGVEGATTSGFTTNALGQTVTPGAATFGTNTISGTVSFTATPPAGSYLYAGVLDRESGEVYAESVQNPTSPWTFTIPDVPSGADFRPFAFLDTQNSGFFGPGGGGLQTPGPDLTAPAVMLSAGQDLDLGNLSLPSANAIPSVVTYHFLPTGGGESYGLQFALADGAKQVTSVQLVSGPNVLVPQDLAVGYPAFSWGASTDVVPPQVGDSYDLLVNYSDNNGGSGAETLTATVTGVVDGATELATVTTAGGSLVDPEFVWQAPATAEAYRFLLSGTEVGESVWQVPSAGILDLYSPVPYGFAGPSIQFGTDPFQVGNDPVVPGLTEGKTYSWTVVAVDSQGNQSATGAYLVP